MNQIVKSVFILLILTMQSCILSEPCGDCTSPPKFFYFEFVDKNTGENLFTNGTFMPSDIDVINLTSSASVEFDFIEENSINILEIYSIGWQSEKVSYEITIADSAVFELYVNAERVFEECCSFTKYHEIRIDNAEYEKGTHSDLYEILIDYKN